MTEIASIELRADSRQVRTAAHDLKDLGSAATGASKNLKAIAAGAAIGAGLALALRAIVKNTIEAEAASAQLNAALKSTKGAAGQSEGALKAHAAALQQVTNFGDDAIVGAEALLLTFTKIGGDVFPRATESILDVAQGLGTDLNSAALQVGKALNDPLLGITALSRAGVQFTDEQKNLIKSFVNTGEVAKAQNIILKELETQFGGSARAARDTLGGALVSLGNAFGDLLEGDSGATGLRDSIEGLTSTLQSEETKQAFAVTLAALAKMASVLVDTAAGFAELALSIGGLAAQTAGAGVPVDDFLAQQERLNRLINERDSRVRARGGNDTANDIKRFDTEIAKLQSLIDLNNDLAKSRGRAEAAQAGAAARSGAAVSPAAPTLFGGADEEEKLQKAIASARAELAGLRGGARGRIEQELLAATGAPNASQLTPELRAQVDVLVQLQKQIDNVAAARKRDEDAAERAAQIAADGATAQQSLDASLRQLSEQLGGPAVAAGNALAATLTTLAEQEQALAAAGLLGAEAQAQLTEARRGAQAIFDETLDSIEKERTALADGLILDLQTEIDMLGLTNRQREIAIALRRAEVEATSEQGKEITALITRLDEERDKISALDDFRAAVSGDLFASFIDGSKSAQDALEDFVSGIQKVIARRLANQLVESLFGQFGQSGGGSQPGIASFFGSLFGGGRANGGPIRAGKLHPINERGTPEVVRVGGRDFVTSPQDGSVRPLSAGSNRSTTINVSVAESTDRRTAEQVALLVSRATRRAEARTS